MSPKRGGRAAPPPVDQEYDIRFANTEVADGWEHLGRQAANNLRRAFERSVPTRVQWTAPTASTDFKGNLGAAAFKGQILERWQYEVTGGGRIWYLLDDATHTALITYAGTGHPKATD
ncbi:hypothetical protein [Streptacidiphilus sp. EB103A]|uniref:hypothetical protein n=1 Tax=Streptacidiphilus sp. EB103A TaxID=3156275 RepID=UPI00351516A9